MVNTCIMHIPQGFKPIALYLLILWFALYPLAFVRMSFTVVKVFQLFHSESLHESNIRSFLVIPSNNMLENLFLV